MYVDGELVKAPTADEHSTICLMVFNGKYTGGGMILDPYACINDGMVDVTWASDPRVNTLMGVNGVMTKAKNGATQVYDHQARLRSYEILADVHRELHARAAA